MSFFETSKSVAQDFIQSLVFVDDRASFDQNCEGTDNILEEQLEEPQLADAIEDVLTESDTSEEEHEKTTEVFDAKTIIDSFANIGIIASIIKPEQSLDINLIENVVKLSKIVDVVVLDIDIQKDNGITANNIFYKIIEEEPRLKLIVFYSGAGIGTISDFSLNIKKLILQKIKIN